MFEIDEIIEIINKLNNYSSFENICKEIGKRHNRLILSTDKTFIKRILEENEIFIFDNNLNIWKLIEPGTLNVNNDIFCNYDFNSKELAERKDKAMQLIENFTNKYPISKIKELTIDEYVIAPNGIGNNDSFCRMLRYDLQILCSMGNVFNTAFEIYKKSDDTVYLSPTYEKEFGNDINRAFTSLKNRIYDFLIAAEKEDVLTMKSIVLNGAMKRKLCSVYFHNKYFMGAVKGYIEKSCEVLGVEYNDSNVYKTMIDLSNWKKSFVELSKLDNISIMWFADYLIRNNLKFNGNKSVTEWILSANPMVYDHISSFEENGFVDWRQFNNFNIGDIVYIYCSKNVHKINAVGKIVKVNMSKNDAIDDTKYWRSGIYENKDINRFFRMELVKTIDNDLLDLSYLKQNGLNAAPQGACKVNEQLSKYLNKVIG